MPETTLRRKKYSVPTLVMDAKHKASVGVQQHDRQDTFGGNTNISPLPSTQVDNNTRAERDCKRSIPEADSVFHGVAGLHGLELGEDGCLTPLRHPVQPHQRRLQIVAVVVWG